MLTAAKAAETGESCPDSTVPVSVLPGVDRPGGFFFAAGNRREDREREKLIYFYFTRETIFPLLGLHASDTGRPRSRGDTRRHQLKAHAGGGATRR